MKKILIIFILINVSTLLFSEPDFRNVNWGDSLESVRNAETSTFVRTETGAKAEYFFYDVSVSFSKASLMYAFLDNKLVVASYSFTDHYYIDNQRYIVDFETIESRLNSKYGEPEDVSIEWLDDSSSYKENKADWGYAISQGELKFKTTWEISETRIVHNLGGFGGTYDGNHTIIYISQKLFYLLEQARSEDL